VRKVVSIAVSAECDEIGGISSSRSYSLVSPVVNKQFPKALVRPQGQMIQRIIKASGSFFMCLDLAVLPQAEANSVVMELQEPLGRK